VKLEFSFTNLEQLKQVYDPALVEKAARETIKQLQGKAATATSRAARDRYNVTASAVKSALTPRLRVDQAGIPTGYLIYLSKRISLRHFAAKARPKVKTARGVRYGARVRVLKTKGSYIVPGGFFGTAKTSGSGQIFQRIGKERLKIKKLTGPSISHMMRSLPAIQSLNELIQQEGDTKFANNLDHFMQKATGLR
jgi:hypothetical protein